MSASYQAAARSLEAAAPQVLAAYGNELRNIRSPLALRSEAWRKARRQAQSIIGECVAALDGHKWPSHIEVWRYSRNVGVDRVEQGIPVSESVRAIELLWRAMDSAARAAVRCEPASERAKAHLRIAATFRSSVNARLYAGAVGYDAAMARGTEALVKEAPDEGGMSRLSQRELDVLAAVEQARTNAQIAQSLGITEATVKRHLYNAYKKLGAVSRIDAVNKAKALTARADPGAPHDKTA